MFSRELFEMRRTPSSFKVGDNSRLSVGENKKHARMMVIFHPGKEMETKEFKSRLKVIDPTDEKVEIFIEDKRDIATLVSPFGIFSGRKRIEDGIEVLM